MSFEKVSKSNSKTKLQMMKCDQKLQEPKHSETKSRAKFETSL